MVLVEEDRPLVALDDEFLVAQLLLDSVERLSRSQEMKSELSDSRIVGESGWTKLCPCGMVIVPPHDQVVSR